MLHPSSNLYAYSKPEPTHHARTSHMPRQAASPTPASDPAGRDSSAGQQWGEWLDTELAARNISNSEFVALLNRPGYDSGQVSRWRTRKSGASIEAAIYVAQTLGTDPARVLRKAGHVDVANLLEKLANGQLPNVDDQVRETMRELASNLPDKEANEIVNDAMAEHRRTMRFVQLQAEEKRRELGIDSAE